MQFVGVVLVHNEDVFVERAIRNVAEVCDRIHVVDHLSTDRTAEILRQLAGELDHLSVVRSPDAADSHRAIEKYAGTDTWVLGVDGDELYDPNGLARLRRDLEGGAYARAFHLKGHVLNVSQLVGDAATGYLAPPSRPVTKLFNLNAVTSWTGCLERLHDGAPRFRPGYGWESLEYVSATTDWESDPLRLLHTCFLRRSSADAGDEPVVRLGLPETGGWKRGPSGFLHRLRRRRVIDPRIKQYLREGSSWKQEWYARGDLVSVDAAPFLGAARA